MDPPVLVLTFADCFAGSDFLCRNHRCIPSELNCDGFDHCGDNSDEPTTCFRGKTLRALLVDDGQFDIACMFPGNSL